MAQGHALHATPEGVGVASAGDFVTAGQFGERVIYSRRRRRGGTGVEQGGLYPFTPSAIAVGRKLARVSGLLFFLVLRSMQ
jgi:hypothetical protein